MMKDLAFDILGILIGSDNNNIVKGNQRNNSYNTDVKVNNNVSFNTGDISKGNSPLIVFNPEIAINININA